MFKIRVDVEKLQEILAENKRNHRDIFLKAQERFRERAIEEFEKRLKRARDGDQIELYVNLPIPEDHTEDYDRAINMLAMSTEPAIELDEQTYIQYVDDDWGWKRQFAMTNASYGIES